MCLCLFGSLAFRVICFDCAVVVVVVIVAAVSRHVRCIFAPLEQNLKKNVPAYIHGTNHFAVLTDMNCNEILSIVQFTVSLSISALLICWPIQFNECMCMGACINGMANNFIRWYEVISTNTNNTHVR